VALPSELVIGIGGHVGPSEGRGFTARLKPCPFTLPSRQWNPTPFAKCAKGWGFRRWFRDSAAMFKSNINGDGQECPSHTRMGGRR